MDENKINDTALENAEVQEKAQKKAFFKKLKEGKIKKIKNQALFKRGGYSAAVIAIFLAALILFNWLVVAISDRFDLKFDMSGTKQNSISADNLEYIKSVKDEVSVVFCADEDEYASGMMSQYASYYYKVSDANESKYYSQTVNLVEKYGDYNKKIKVQFVDTQSTEFAAIASKYANENVAYGDIIVSREITDEQGNKTNRYKIINYEDIYTLADESGYAAYGYAGYTISQNNIETALTSAISYVTSLESKKIQLITGHSSANYYSEYVKLLENNGYEVSVSTEKLVNSISQEFDAVAIVAPSKDFVGSEIDAISEFLSNGEALGKGLIYFADATVPMLPNFSDFLLQWGIKVDDGILFETNPQNHVEGSPSTLGSLAVDTEITKGMSYCITNYNMPITTTEPDDDRITVTELITTLDSVVVAPKGADASWNDYKDSDKGLYATVVAAEKTDTNIDKEEVSSYVMAFSSVEFIYSDWAEYNDLSNKNIALAATDRASGADNSGISFISKTIANQSFADSVTEGNVALVRIIFMILIPLVVIVMGVVIFIRRKNA